MHCSQVWHFAYSFTLIPILFLSTPHTKLLLLRLLRILQVFLYSITRINVLYFYSNPIHRDRSTFALNCFFFCLFIPVLLLNAFSYYFSYVERYDDAQAIITQLELERDEADQLRVELQRIVDERKGEL